jgi:hypothetical protein
MNFIWRGRQKECGVKRWVKKLPWKFFDSWNMGLRFPIWDWVAGAMTKCIVPAWLYCAPHVSGSYSSYIVYAFSAVTLFDNKFTLPASCKLKVGTIAQWGQKNNFQQYTVVGLSTDPAPLIISNFFKFRVLWSLSKSMIIIKCMLSVWNWSKMFSALKVAFLGQFFWNFLKF